MAGAPLVIDPKDIGVANGIEFSIRGVLSALAGECYLINREIQEVLLIYMTISFDIRYHCK